MDDTRYCLLLTGTIDSGHFLNSGVTVTDTQERFSQYEAAIQKYISSSVFHKIVIAENSGYPFDASDYIALAKEYGKEFEYLYIETDVKKTIQRGKSYGEAILIRKAIENSELLHNESHIYKCTGRVFVENTEELCDFSDSTAFLAHNARHICFTVFFKLNKREFSKLFTNLENECDDYNGAAIENVLYERCLKYSLKPSCFKKYPRLRGICGTNGNPYDRSKSNLLLKDIMIRCGLFTFGKKNFLQKALVNIICRRYPDIWW